MNLLVPTDFSPVAASAGQVGLQLASALGAQVHFVHVFGMHQQIRFRSLEDITELEQQAREAAKQNLHTFVRSTQEQTGAEVVVNELVKLGIAFEQVLSLLEHGQYAAVVMGARGENNLSAKLLGTNTEAILSDSPVPVIIVPEKRTQFPVKRMALVAEPGSIDFTKLAFMEAIRQSFGAELMAVGLGTWADEDRKALTDACQPNEWRDVRPKNLTDLYQVLDDAKVDWLTMVHHRRNFFQRVFTYDFTETVARHPQTPVLVIPQ